MKTASLNELKKELAHLETKQLVEVCLRLVRYKKENKELLNYLLFDAEDEATYRMRVKEVVDEQFMELPSHLYQAVKGLRKILRGTNKYIKFSGSKQTEVELLIYFLMKLRRSGLKIYSSTVLTKMFETQLKKIDKAISTLHEDLQYDYQQELKEIS